jgi:hypothetical protein
VAGAIHCLNCSHVIPRDYWNDLEETTCRGCGERVRARVFPAFDRVRPENAAAARIQAEGDSSCFYHPTNQAAIACDDCGRFLCTLCDLDVDGRHLCPACLDRGVFVEKAASLEERRTLYDSIALHLVTWPVVTVWFPIFTAPTAIFLIFRHWKTPMSILPRTRVRLWIALLLGILEVGGILALLFVLIWVVLKAGPK